MFGHKRITLLRPQTRGIQESAALKAGISCLWPSFTVGGMRPRRKLSGDKLRWSTTVEDDPLLTNGTRLPFFRYSGHVWEGDRAALNSLDIREDSPQVESQITTSVQPEMNNLITLAHTASLAIRSWA